MPDYDVLTIGAGHNALVASAYLAQAGLRVGVFERRPMVGGTVATVEQVPGYRFDLGGSAHILIRNTPVVEELGLERFGLEYLEVDPLFFAPFEDGDHLLFHRSEATTIEAIEARFPGEGEAYGRFLDDWRGFAREVRDLFLATPNPLTLAAFGRRVVPGDWRRALPRVLKPYGELVDDYFREEKVKAPLVWMAAQSGPPPGEPFTSPFLLWHPLYHEGGVARPRGGSGMLTRALARHVEAHGGQVHVGAPVDAIVVERGRATGVRVGEDVHSARVVLSGAHALETFGRLLPPAQRPPGAANMRAGNGFGAIMRLALSGPIRYPAHPHDEARRALQLICRDRSQVAAAYGDYLAGRPAADPPIVAMSFSALDATLAPPGGEVLWLWAQYYPYRLAGGRTWDELAPEVERSILDAFEVHAPGTRAKVVGSLFQHPAWLEREFGLFGGNVMHLEMSLDQMFALRPFLGAHAYRAPGVRGLYLTGASTHPGGGIMGAAGRNAAREVLRDMRRPGVVLARALAGAARRVRP